MVNLLAPLSTIEPEEITALVDGPSVFQRSPNWQKITVPNKRLKALTQKKSRCEQLGAHCYGPAIYFTLHEATPRLDLSRELGK